MAMTFEESAALMTNMDFRGRVKVAVLQYATSVFAQTGNSSSKTKWAQQTMQSPDAEASRVTPSVVMNTNVQSFGKDIDDANLAAAVQVTADMMM